MSWPHPTRPHILRGRPTRGGHAARPAARVHGPAPPARTAAVAIQSCTNYRYDEVLTALSVALDDLGGLGQLVRGKSVAVKVNLTGRAGVGVLSRPANQTYRTHPSVALALVHLLARAGARRVRFLDGPLSQLSLREFVALDGWDLGAFTTLGIPVEFASTRNRAPWPDYTQLKVPGGGRLFPSYWVNRAYVDCDVLVSLAKLKNHLNAGVTLSAKNLFGLTPPALYGRAGADENHVGPRMLLHESDIVPPAGLPSVVATARALDEHGRVARHIVDAITVRPIDLAVIEGISTVAGGAGPWARDLRFVRPGLIIAGRNTVATDAVATACMGYDPAAAHGTGPFPGDNHLRLAAEAGLGTVDLDQIDVRGLPIANAHYDFGWNPGRSPAPA